MVIIVYFLACIAMAAKNNFYKSYGKAPFTKYIPTKFLKNTAINTYWKTWYANFDFLHIYWKVRANKYNWLSKSPDSQKNKLFDICPFITLKFQEAFADLTNSFALSVIDDNTLFATYKAFYTLFASFNLFIDSIGSKFQSIHFWTVAEKYFDLSK